VTPDHSARSRGSAQRRHLRRRFTASVDIYLDPSKLASGEASTIGVGEQAGRHFCATSSSMSPRTPRPPAAGRWPKRQQLRPGGDLEDGPVRHVPNAAGWYTFEENFRDLGDGTLADDMVVRDASAPWYSARRWHPATC